MKNESKDQLNRAREDVNSRVKNLKGLGKTKGIAWKSKRRNKNI